MIACTTNHVRQSASTTQPKHLGKRQLPDSVRNARYSRRVCQVTSIKGRVSTAEHHSNNPAVCRKNSLVTLGCRYLGLHGLARLWLHKPTRLVHSAAWMQKTMISNSINRAAQKATNLGSVVLAAKNILDYWLIICD